MDVDVAVAGLDQAGAELLALHVVERVGGGDVGGDDAALVGDQGGEGGDDGAEGAEAAVGGDDADQVADGFAEALGFQDG